MKIKKITIINAVPLNGGDEALLVSTIRGLNDYFSNPSIHVLTNNPGLCKKYIDNIDFDYDWEYVFLKPEENKNILLFRVKRKIRTLMFTRLNISYYSGVSKFFASGAEKRVHAVLNNSDIVLLSAGGYIHDFYGYGARLKTVEALQKEFKKKVIFFGQSIGPFWIEQNFPVLHEIFSKSDKIILREKYSLGHLKNIKYHCDNVHVTNDVAFYLSKVLAKKVDTGKTLKKIAVNFREWAYEEEGEGILEKAGGLCEYLIDKGYELTFLSTCQGVEGYVDDSVIAKRIIDKLDSTHRQRCTILGEKYTLNEMVELLSMQGAFIGMRMHVAVLSLFAGIPFLSIGYEDKALGIFESLGLNKNVFSYKDDQGDWISATETFIDNYTNHLNNIEGVLSEAFNMAEKNFKLLLN